MSSLAVIAKQVFTNGKIQPAIVLVDEGKITKILLNPTQENEKEAEKTARVIKGKFWIVQFTQGKSQMKISYFQES